MDIQSFSKGVADEGDRMPVVGCEEIVEAAYTSNHLEGNGHIDL